MRQGLSGQNRRGGASLLRPGILEPQASNQLVRLDGSIFTPGPWVEEIATRCT